VRPSPFPHEPLSLLSFFSFGAFGRPSKGRFFALDALKWTPSGFPTWLLNRGKNPGLMNLRENKKYVHEVAAKLIENKRQELKDGASRKDLLSLLGSLLAAQTMPGAV
jgi:hypothetical protein